MLSVLDTVRDESDKTAPVRLVLEPKSSRQERAGVRATCCSPTPGSKRACPINLVMLGRDGRPRPKNLKQIIEEWIAFRFETVTRRTQHRLGEVDRRIHILEGRQLALLSIDKVIRIIRKADEPKADLIADVRTDRHSGRRHPGNPAAAAGAARGYQDRERTEGTQGGAQGTEAHPVRRRKRSPRLSSRRSRPTAAQFGDARRTLIEAVAPTVVNRAVPDEPVTITVSRHGWMRSRQGHGLDAHSLPTKPATPRWRCWKRGA